MEMVEPKSQTLLLWNDNPFAKLLQNHFGTENVVTSASALEDKSGALSAYQGIILLAELNWAEHKLSELYGIEFAKTTLRIKYKVRGPILFVSFLDLKEILQNPQNKIVTAVGHDFIRLPSHPEKWQELINNMTPLTDLQFIDVVNNFCDLKGLVGEIIHRLQGDFRALVSRPNEAAWAALKSKLEHGLEEIANLLGKPAVLEFKIPELIRRFQADIIDRKNLTDADNFVARMGEELKALVADEGENEKSVEVVADLQMPWQVLILDDEPDSLKPIVEALHARGINPVVVNHFADAEQKIAADVYNKIVVAISDYRLLEQVDGIQKLQRKQGYDFLFDLSKQDRFISLVALSGMGRRFLLESFQKYNTRVAVFSKNDLSTPAAANLFADRILEMGTEVYETLCSQPQGSAWEELKKFYLAHRQNHDYAASENDMSRWARDYVLKIEAIWMSKNKEWHLHTALPTLGELQAKMNGKDPHTPKYMKQFRNKLIARRIALWLYFVKGCEPVGIYHALNGRLDISKRPATENDKDENKAKALINANLALTFSDFPAGILVEEKRWLKYDMGMGIDLNDLEEELRAQIFYYAQAVLEEWFKNHSNLAKRLAAQTELLTKAGRPVITNRYDAKKLLFLIEKHLSDEAQRKQYGAMLARLLAKIREDQYGAKYFAYYDDFITDIIKRLMFK